MFPTNVPYHIMAIQCLLEQRYCSLCVIVSVVVVLHKKNYLTKSDSPTEMPALSDPINCKDAMVWNNVNAYDENLTRKFRI